MFYALKEGILSDKDFHFIHNRADTETLNNIAFSQSGDVIAISVFAYAFTHEHYLMLPHGGSVGRNYGPVIIAKEPFSIDDLKKKKLAIPGAHTTAANVVKMLSPDQLTEVVPIDPFYAIFDSIEKDEVDAGLVIHEGRMCYEQMGFKKIIDIGEWWQDETGFPLPLGANVIRKSLSQKTLEKLSTLLGKSIRWAIENREQLIPYLQSLKSDLERQLGLADKKTISDYLDLYANQSTLKYEADEIEGMQVFFDRAYDHGLVPEKIRVEFAPDVTY